MAERARTSEADAELTVGRVAELVGVSVRTLHHWDETGLVRPGSRTPGGYRLYTADDIARVHRVMIYRELGLSLAEIGDILDDPAIDAREHLRRQRTQLTERIARLGDTVTAVDRMLSVLRSGIQLTPRQQAEIFGEEWEPSWGVEAEARWGDTPQWTQYAERTAAMTPEDFKRLVRRTEALNAELAAARRAGVTPGSAAANALAERHRELMSTYFDCDHAMHVCVARTYDDDPRFAERMDADEPGLTAWLSAIVFANARAHGVEAR